MFEVLETTCWCSSGLGVFFSPSRPVSMQEHVLGSHAEFLANGKKAFAKS